MTLSLVSLMASNVDRAAADLAASLSAAGIDTVFQSGSYAHRKELVATDRADIVWLCGWQALELEGSPIELVAAPSFPEEVPSTYRSFIVSRSPTASLEELVVGDARWATNEPSSWSGHWALRAECDLRGLPAPSSIVWSGSHAESIRAVVDGSADAAAIDSTVWRSSPHQGLDVIDVTRAWPAPPILVRRADRDRTKPIVAQIVQSGGLRGVDALVPVDWSHLDPMRPWVSV